MRKFLQYGLNGAINTVVTYGLYVLLVRFIDYRIAIVLVYIVGIALLYYLHSALVFGAPGRIGSFVMIYVCLMVVNIVLTWSIVESLNWSKEAAQLPAILVVFIVGFVLNKRFVFSPRGS